MRSDLEAELFRLHYRRLLRGVGRDVHTVEANVEDAVAFAFLQLCQKPPADPGSPGGWLRVVARHQALRLDREQRRTDSLDAPLGRLCDAGQEPLTLADTVAAPVDTELAFRAREALRALADLRWRRRRVLELKVAGYSYREIQDQLGITYTNVNRQLTRGRKDLRSAA